MYSRDLVDWSIQADRSVRITRDQERTMLQMRPGKRRLLGTDPFARARRSCRKAQRAEPK
jgi:hypothetical protein